MVTIPLKCSSLGTALQFAKVGFRHILKAEPQLRCQLSHIPEHVPEFERDIIGELLIHDAAAIANQLFHLVGNLPGLTGETEGRVDQIPAGIGVASRAA